MHPCDFFYEQTTYFPKCEGTFNVDNVTLPPLVFFCRFSAWTSGLVAAVPAAGPFAGCMSDTRPGAGRLRQPNMQEICRLLVNKVQTTLKPLLRFLLSNTVQCFGTCRAALNSFEWFGVPPDRWSYYSGRNDPWLSISNAMPHRSSLRSDKLDNLSQQWQHKENQQNRPDEPANRTTTAAAKKEALKRGFYSPPFLLRHCADANEGRRIRYREEGGGVIVCVMIEV